MARRILIVTGVLIVVLVAVIFMQPDTFSVERAAIMAAPPAAVFAQVNDLAAWDGWSPWKKLDPNPKTTISSPSAGEGATCSWSGNNDVGEGTLTILRSRPAEMVEIEQVFVRPFAGKARHTFTLAPQEGGTRLTWRMDGTNNFVGKALCLVMDMDSVLGKDFEQGLANMRAIVENRAAAPVE